MTRARLHRLALLAFLAGGCSSPIESGTSVPPPLTGAGPFVVSNSVTNGPASAAGSSAGSGSSAVAYVSLPPGTLPEGNAVILRVFRTGIVVPAALVDGGLDPVAVPAIAGDTISLTLTGSAGAVSVYTFVVPVRKPPVIVRTRPARNKRDVPLNIRLEVVFSEPIDATSLTPQNIELRSGSGAVDGQLAVANGSHTSVEFTPAADLAPGREYELVLRSGIRDFEGAPLEAGVSVPFVTLVAPPAALEYGSVAGTIRGSGSGYPVNGNGMPGESTWPVFTIDASGPAQLQRYTAELRPDSFEFAGLAAGTWSFRFDGMAPWPGVFPEMRVYHDTTITVTVLPNQTVVVPEVVLRPVAPFIVIATERCPWGFNNTPTFQDWWDCDSGYWGGIDAEVEVRGVPGTLREAVRYSLVISRNQWHVELRDIPVGEYDVSVVPLESHWRLLPWLSSTVRVRVDRGLAYAEFDYWYLK